MNEEQLKIIKEKIMHNIECSFDVGGSKYGYNMAANSILELLQELINELNEVHKCEIETITKTEQVTEKHCNGCNEDCDNCSHREQPYYTYKQEVFDYYKCKSCNYKYGFLEEPNNFCPSCGYKITALNGSTTHDDNEATNVSS